MKLNRPAFFWRGDNVACESWIKVEMADLLYKLIRDSRRAAEMIDSKQPLKDRSSRCKNILFIAVFATSLISAQAALTQQTGPGVNKIPAQTAIPNAGAIPEAWPVNVPIERVSDVGRHKAVIFSPDFAESGNRELYEGLGFLYIEDASWRNALNQIVARNYWHPEVRIETIILETHGTNGNGLKLQAGPSPRANRSYISIAALQEQLEGIGVRLCVIGACNSGRLFRPEIYKTLNPQPHDRLFLPPTLGIINASKDYDPARSKMIVVRRAESEIETTSDGNTSELSPLTRILLRLEQPNGRVRAARPLHFVVSNLLIQMLIHDPRLQLTASGYANEKSKNDLSEVESDALFQRFLAYLDGIAAREYQVAQGGRLPPPSIAPTRAATRSPIQTRRTQTTLPPGKKRTMRRVID